MVALLSFMAADIRLEGVAVDIALPSAWLADKLADTEIFEPERGGRIRGRLSRSGTSDIVVRTRVTANLAVACVRCLEPATVDVDADMSLLLVPASRADGRRNGKPSGRDEVEHEFSAEEAHHDVYDGETVILDDFVRELLLLEVPSFPLCRDDCPGISVDVAQPPRASDPRLAALSAFRDEPEGQPVTIDDLVAAAKARSAQLRGEGGTGKRAVLRSSHAAAPVRANVAQGKVAQGKVVQGKRKK